MRVHPPCRRFYHQWQFIGVRRFQFTQAAVFQHGFGQGIVLRKFLQHILVGTGCAFGCFFDHGHAEFFKENFTNLFGAVQVKRLTRELMRMGFEAQQLLSQTIRLMTQLIRINQHPSAFNREQHVRRGQFNRFIHGF